MVPLKAALLPMLIKERRAANTVTTRMATTGMVVRLSIYIACQRQELFMEATYLTMLSAREKGRPLSRAKDQVIRDAAARQPIALQNSRAIMMQTMMVAPASEPTDVWKIRMKGDSEDSSMSKPSMLVALKSTASSNPTARVPLIPRLISIDRGTSVLAFLTSSDICERQSRLLAFSVCTYMHDRIGSDKGQCITLQTNEESQRLRWPLPLIVEGSKYVLRTVVCRGEIYQGHEDSEEA